VVPVEVNSSGPAKGKKEENNRGGKERDRLFAYMEIKETGQPGRPHFLGMSG